MGNEFNDINGMGVDEILGLLDAKRIQADRKREEIKKLRSAIESTQSVKTNTLEEVIQENNTDIIDNDEDFEKEVEYYLSDFNGLKEFTKESIEDILPSFNNYNYEKIVLRIIAEVTHDIKDINEIIASDSKMNIDELKEYKEELNSLLERRAILKDILLTEEKKDIEEKSNNLIFMPINGTNEVRIFDDLKAIPQEEYEGFIELFKSIKDGTFKNIRRFTNNENFNGAIEVKGHQIRVVFQRLSKDSYCIIAIFMKKTQNDYGYRNNLNNRYSEYKSMEKELKDKVKPSKEADEFIKKNKEIEDKLFSILSNNKSDGRGGIK